jgi:hypothetical protein
MSKPFCVRYDQWARILLLRWPWSVLQEVSASWTMIAIHRGWRQTSRFDSPHSLPCPCASVGESKGTCGLLKQRCQGLDGLLKMSAHMARDHGATSSRNSFVATYKYRSRRFSLVKTCTQERNRCSPSKLVSPSAATSSSFLFSRA